MADHPHSKADQALDAWFLAIERLGWHRAKLEDASRLSGLPREEIVSLVRDPFDALAIVLRGAEASAIEAAQIGAAQGEGTARERLFDGLMAGFDVVQPWRGALLSILRSRDPGVAFFTSANLPGGVRRLAGAAGLPVNGPTAVPALATLASILVRAVWTWSEDESPDLAATMARIDGLLAQAEESRGRRATGWIRFLRPGQEDGSERAANPPVPVLPA